MSHKYDSANAASAMTKCVSRAKIAHDILSVSKRMKRVTHYLGGTSARSPFEQFFNRGTDSFFVRYEKRNCAVPKSYMEALWDEEGLIPKEKKHLGYFVNGDFFDHFGDYVEAFPEHTHDMWLDFCGMPVDSLLEDLNNKVFKGIYSDKIRLVYVTFYANHRGFDNVKSKMHGKSVEEKAKSLANYFSENVLTLTDFSCEAFDSYLNDRSPMIVLKFMKKPKQNKTITANAMNYVILKKHFSDDEIQTLWGVSHQTIAAYKAWATMRGVSYNTSADYEVAVR